jgi:toxin ParE1/3/4
MRYEVLMTEGAARDLEELHNYISIHDSPENAAHVLDEIEKIVESLASLPSRGAHPKELQAFGIQEYREAFFKPYRVIYRVIQQQVFIYLIADGRRDFRALLEKLILR